MFSHVFIVFKLMPQAIIAPCLLYSANELCTVHRTAAAVLIFYAQSIKYLTDSLCFSKDWSLEETKITTIYLNFRPTLGTTHY